MKSSILALMLAGLMTGPALAQQATPATPDHNAHHPQSAQAGSGSSAATPPAMQGPAMSGSTAGALRPGGMMPGMGQGMMGQGMMGQGMMSCPMMQGGMQMSQPRGDQSVASLAMNAVNERMHREMAMEYTGNVDADFARNMIAHHQGAIDMARIALAFGKNAQIRQLAEAIVKAQEEEITAMKAWLAQNAKP